MDVNVIRKNVGVLFDDIARRYDLLNRILSFGMDIYWRKRVCAWLPKKNCLQVLDVACGTGDLTAEIARLQRVESVDSVDLSSQMIDVAKFKLTQHKNVAKVSLRVANVLAMPFEENRFDVVTVAFGVRNFHGLLLSLQKMHSVLKPGGQLIVLELTVPPWPVIRLASIAYLRLVVPLVGGMISGNREAYRYLNETIESFPAGRDFLKVMTEAGFKKCQFRRLSLGIATVYRGEKIG